MKTTITLFSTLALAASLSFGQEGPPPGGPGGPPPGGPGGPHKRPDPEQIFKKLDANSDKLLSLDEFKASPMAKKNPEKAEEIYKKMDADSNNEVTFDEFKSHRLPHREGPGKDGPRKGKGKDKPPGDAPAPAPAAE